MKGSHSTRLGLHASWNIEASPFHDVFLYVRTDGAWTVVPGITLVEMNQAEVARLVEELNAAPSEPGYVETWVSLPADRAERFDPRR